MSQRPAIFFLHMPKTGGVSLQSVLAAQVPPQRSLLAVESHVVMPPTGGSLAHFDLVTGHLPWALRHLLRRPYRSVSLFRDPWKRAFSAYAHLLRDRAHGHYDLARREAPTFADAIRHPALRWHFLSPYTRLLGADDAPLLAALRQGPEAVDHAVRHLPVGREPDEGHLERALRAVEELDLIGLTETLEEDAPRLLGSLIGDPRQRLPRLNRTREFPPFDKDGAHREPLAQALRHDLILWEAVQRRVERDRALAA